MVDKTGSIARWRQQDDIMSFGSETEGPKKLQAFALIPPAAHGIQARLHGNKSVDFANLRNLQIFR